MITTGFDALLFWNCTAVSLVCFFGQSQVQSQESQEIFHFSFIYAAWNDVDIIGRGIELCQSSKTFKNQRELLI